MLSDTYIDTCEGSQAPLCCAVLYIVMCTNFLLCCPLLQTVFWQEAFSRCLWSWLDEADTDKEFWQVSKPNCKFIFCLCVARHVQAYSLMPLESVDSTYNIGLLCCTFLCLKLILIIIINGMNVYTVIVYKVLDFAHLNINNLCTR